MALVIEFTCDLPNGVHARPASLVETLCNRFSSAIEWRNLRRGTGGNAKSALAIIGSNTLKGDACQLLISGEDEAEAFAAITAFMRDEFLTVTRRCPLRQRWMSSRCQSRFRG